MRKNILRAQAAFPAVMLFVMVAAVATTACRVSYSLSGASISPLAKTVSIAYIPNNASMVAPILSPTLRDALQDRFMGQTRLSVVREGGDFAFEGEITGYTAQPSAMSSSSGMDAGASLYKLTITVHMRFTNSIEPKLSYDKSFSKCAEYDANKLLQSVEPTLIPEIVDQLVDDIFNAATSNW
ncbi:MAG: LPS assembly lipoprotein LptE [Rikenellaceae bacterium]|nr:LPS assembly lipoprotein LptE [Rikenellaceae bacterium]